ncbi:hypothetical protein THMIRHAS_14310 [Thiosulfatimonas sediminis]|uniref:Uncharacterized protein n=1 Tax=Thiosulfatimonas sediminis TaxID=2675054 RepID=A0A6F8PVM7_9GAMM|nr:hypothetical protein [Thiosulfatimonas sediminis]BBP46058.1 hypothetical protein THMIRHAS_14310 [Thiosulfatimonas sediminis]
MVQLMQMIPTALKMANAQAFAQVHQSSLFACDLSQDTEAWQPGWEFLIDRVDLNADGKAQYVLEKGESKSGEESVFVLDLGDIDASWFIICLRFGIESWDRTAILNALQSDFYGSDIALKNLQNEQVKLLSEHVDDFLARFPEGGLHGVTCDMAELFTLEEDFSVTQAKRQAEQAALQKAKDDAQRQESECPFF